MVALSGAGWKLAPCLISLVEEADSIAPSRSRIADGSIGDTAHASRTSDHNPAYGWVTAVDLTHDPGGGFDAHARARLAIGRQDHRIKYVISKRQIARSYWSTVSSSNQPVNRSEVVSGRIPPWAWAHYTGSNPHDRHAHFSVNNAPASRNDTSPWWPHSPATQPKPTTEDKDDMHAGLIIAAYAERYGELSKQVGKDMTTWIHAVYAKPPAERDGAVAYIRAQLGLT